MKDDTFHFRVDTPAFLNEMASCALPKTAGVLKVPLNVFRNHLGLVAQRAIELDDPELNVLMLELNLYEVGPYEIVAAIERQKKRIVK